MGNEKGKIKKRILITLIILSLTCSNFILASSYIIDGLISYAIGEEETTETKEEVAQENIIPFEMKIDEIFKTGMNTEKTEYDENLSININYLENSNKIEVKDTQTAIYSGEEITDQEIVINYKTTKMNKTELEKVFLAGFDVVIKKLGVEEGEEDVLAVINKDTEADEDGIITINHEEEIGQIAICVVPTANEVIESEEVMQEANNVVIVEAQQNNTEIVNQLQTNEIVQNNIDNEIENVAENVIENNQTVEVSPIVENKEESETEELLPQPIMFNVINTKVIGEVNDKDTINMLQTKKEYTTESDEKTLSGEFTVQTKIREKYTRAELGIDKTDLSTTQPNDVIYTITLHAESDKKYNLYKNPVFLIELPSWVEKIEILNTEILNNQAFTIKKIRESTSINGNNAILIALEGEQLEATISELENVQIALSAKISTTNLMPSVEAETVLYYTNENATSYEDETDGYGIDNAKTIFIANSELITASTAQVDESKVTSFKSDYKTLPIRNSENQSANVLGQMINNTGNDLNNVKVLGTSDVLSQITTNMENAIIYYSENADATASLDIAENLWSLEYTENCAKYLICIDNLSQGATLAFASSRVLPTETAEYISTYSVYNDANEVIGNSQVTIKQTAVLLDVNIETSSGAETVYTGQDLLYTITVTNVGEVEATNVNISAVISEGLTLPQVPTYTSEAYMEQVTSWNNITLVPGESIEKQIVSTINKNIDLNQLNMQVNVSADYLKTLVTKTATNKVRESDVLCRVEGITYGDNNAKRSELVENGTLTEYITLINTTNNVINDISVEVKLPNGGEYKECPISKNNNGQLEKLTGDINVENGIVTVSNINLQPKEVIYIDCNIKMIEYVSDIVNTKIEVNNGDNSITYIDKQIMEKPATIVASLNSEEIGKELKAGDEIKYTLNIQNVDGKREEVNVELPDLTGLNVKQMTITTQAGKETLTMNNIENNSIQSNIMIEEQDTAIVEIIAEVQELAEDTKLTSFATISDDNVGTIVTNSLSNTIIKAEKEEINIPETEGNTQEQNEIIEVQEKIETVYNTVGVSTPNQKVGQYSISGLAWLDKNEDGKRDSDEAILSDVTVYLIETSTGKTLETTITNAKGEYNFINLSQGNYMLVFGYNAAKYMVENNNYQKIGVSDNENSDALIITEDGMTKAITNTISINNTNADNIDIGLVLSKVFDLSLTKTIKKVTVDSAEGKTVVEYKNNTLAKVEIPAKFFQGSTAIIEYEIAITNNGEVTGIVSMIEDEFPSTLKYSSELNTNWYEDEGKLYSAALAGTEIKPGETKKLTLILTKTIPDMNATTIVNKAKILESFNEYLIEDNNENEESEATLIISIKTGEKMRYISLILGCLAIISVGMYLIQKKVVKK